MSNDSPEPRTVNITPTWTAMLPLLLEICTNAESVESRKAAAAELVRMAEIADRYVAAQQQEAK